MTSQTVTDANSVARAVKRARRQGLAVVALAVVFGIAVTGWMGGWFGPSMSSLAGTLAIAPSANAEMPRPRQGLVPSSENKGQIIFGRYCDSCHPGGEASKGKSLVSPEFRRDFENEFQIAQLVREGTCVMPKYDRFLLPDGDLAEIAKFTLARAKADGSPPPPPLDGPGIMREKCATCHNTLDPPLDPRDPQVTHAVEVDMGRCAGLTAVQKKVLIDFLLRSQGR